MATGEDFPSGQKLDQVRALEPVATVDHTVQVRTMQWMLRATCNTVWASFCQSTQDTE